MSWTPPRTWVANTRLDDVTLNAHVRDNMLETGPAKVTDSGQLLVSVGLNQIAARGISMAAESTTYTRSAGNLEYQTTATGPDVTITTGTSALAFWGALINGQVATYAYYSVSPTVTAATSYPMFFRDNLDTWALHYGASRIANDPFRGMSFKLFTGLIPQSNVFKSLYRYDGAGTATFSNRFLIVLAL